MQVNFHISEVRIAAGKVKERKQQIETCKLISKIKINKRLICPSKRELKDLSRVSRCVF
jgi:hypothetical protein